MKNAMILFLVVIVSSACLPFHYIDLGKIYVENPMGSIENDRGFGKDII